MFTDVFHGGYRTTIGNGRPELNFGVGEFIADPLDDYLVFKASADYGASDDDGRVAVGCSEGAKREPSASGGVAVGILQCECIGVLLSGLEISQRNRVFGCSVRTLYDSGCSVVLTDVF